MSTIENSREFAGARFLRTSFRGATLRGCDISEITVRGSELNGLDLDSHDLAFGTLLVNGVDVVPFVEAELDRLFPGRDLSRSRTPDGLREGWAAVQDAWQATLEATPPELVDAHVPDEWSLAQTLRHLILATDAWLGGGIHGEERVDPWGSTGWRPTVGDCLRTILEEEWAHLRYVRRDLSLLA